ncbi:MAG: hypothetical protein M9918_13595 [Anaerolineae bacterium]|nr:hypothetical protein [Anaerolineae bacterium]
MKRKYFILMAVLISSLVLVLSVQAATPLQPYSQGFEVNASGWFDYGTGTVAQVPSGTNGITSASGIGHGEVTATSVSYGPFSRFAAYSDMWPTGGWTAELDVYLDISWPLGSGFEWDVAANGTDNEHQRDFIFHITKDTSTGMLLVAGSNNSNYAPREDLETLNHYVVLATGWYTLQHVFRDDAGVLAVDLNLLDSGGTILFTETRSAPSDTIPAEVGGNRYGWFTTVSPAFDLAIDNQEICLGNGPCSPATVSLSPAGPVEVCDTATVSVDFSDVYGLYGYQFRVTYDETLVNAVGAFDNTHFDTTGAFIPPGWGAVCDDMTGECQFAASLQSPDVPVDVTGTVATVDLTAVETGTSSIEITDLVLTDIDGFPISADLGDAVTVTSCGTADVSGTISLQGRYTPVTAGTVTVTDTSSSGFGPYSAAFDATTGDYTVTGIKVLPTSTFEIEAAHDLYLTHAKTLALTSGGSVTDEDTRLLGGDANLDLEVNILDLACIGADFDGTPSVCGGVGSTDINADATVNIQDLAIAAGNFSKTSPQPWD